MIHSLKVNHVHVCYLGDLRLDRKIVFAVQVSFAEINMPLTSFSTLMLTVMLTIT